MHGDSIFPSNIITQILYRLPSKSVARFRCVSKGWLSLLTDPKFIKTHHKTLNRNHLIFSNKNTNGYDTDTSSYYSCLYSHLPSHDHDDPFILKPTRLPIVFDGSITFNGSCDGLVLVSARYMGDFGTLVLLNPTTRKSVQFQQPSYHPQKINQESPFHEGATHGFGYDSVTDDYKVITITYFKSFIYDRCLYRQLIKTTNCLSIYSLRSNTWRHLFIDSPYDCRFSPPAVYVNGFLHWVANKKSDDSWVIVAFSLADECFSEVPSPGSCNDHREIMPNRNCKLVVLGGKLAIYVNDVKFKVWLMNEYGVQKSWTKIPLDVFDSEFCMARSVIFDDDNGKIRVAGKGQMLKYDFEKRTLSENAYVWSCLFRVFGSYVESLVSLPKRDVEQVIDDDSSTERHNVGSKAASELADLPENLDPICHHFRNKLLRCVKILNDKDSSTERHNAGSKAASELADLPENLDPICHHFRNKLLRCVKILNDKKESLIKRERDGQKAKVKNKRKFKKYPKNPSWLVEEYDLINDGVSLGDSS